MVLFIDLFVIFISLLLAALNLKKVTLGSRYIIYYLFWGIYVLPLLLDYLIGFPDYSSSYQAYGFKESYLNSNVRVLYDIFLLVVQCSILCFSKIASYPVNNKQTTFFDGILSKRTLFILLLISFVPAVFCIFFKYPSILFVFGWRETMVDESFVNSSFYSFVEKLSYFSCLSSICVLMSRPSKSFSNLFPFYFLKVLALLSLYMNVCIESKRSIVFFCLLIFLIIKIHGWGKKIKLKSILFLVIVFVAILVASSVYVKIIFREKVGFSEIYTNIRTDLFRDDTVKLVIHSLIDETQPRVLSYPFQSYLTQIASIFPLDFLSGLHIINIPLIGFNTFLTAALTHSPIEISPRWMTTSVADEMFANFGFAALLLLPLFFFFVSRRIDKMNGLNKIVWLTVIVLLMMYSLNYIMYFIQEALLLLVLLRSEKKRIRYINASRYENGYF